MFYCVIYTIKFIYIMELINQTFSLSTKTISSILELVSLGHYGTLNNRGAKKHPVHLLSYKRRPYVRLGLLFNNKLTFTS